MIGGELMKNSVFNNDKLKDYVIKFYKIYSATMKKGFAKL
jgi:hypothetical protein